MCDAHACVEPRKEKISRRCKDDTCAKTREEIIRDAVEAIACDTDSGDPHTICSSIIAAMSIWGQSSHSSTEAKSFLWTRPIVAGTNTKERGDIVSRVKALRDGLRVCRGDTSEAAWKTAHALRYWFVQDVLGCKAAEQESSTERPMLFPLGVQEGVCYGVQRHKSKDAFHTCLVSNFEGAAIHLWNWRIKCPETGKWKLLSSDVPQTPAIHVVIKCEDGDVKVRLGSDEEETMVGDASTPMPPTCAILVARRAAMGDVTFPPNVMLGCRQHQDCGV